MILDLENISEKDLKDHTALSEEYKKYLMDVLEYDEEDAKFVIALDFKNPYETVYIRQDYEGIATIGAHTYEVCACRTDFRLCGMFHLADKPPFEFYMLFDKDTMPDRTVGSYMKSRKVYLLKKDDR